MPDRLERGVWPHPALSFDEVADFLAKVLKQGDIWFPFQREPHRPGEVVREGGTIERQGENRYIYRAIASHALSPRTTLHATETTFLTPRDAALHYLRWDLNLPGDLDGWKVV